MGPGGHLPFHSVKAPGFPRWVLRDPGRVTAFRTHPAPGRSWALSPG